MSSCKTQEEREFYIKLVVKKQLNSPSTYKTN